MDPPKPDASHSDEVDAWIARVIDRAAPAEQLDLFRTAVEAVWNRAAVTLGSVTLIAIADRVLTTAIHRHGFLAAVNPRQTGDTRWKSQVRDRLAAVPPTELIAGLRFALIDLLTVIGRLTAEILSPELHAALRDVTVQSLDAEPPTGLHILPSILAGKAQS
jgi:hypothetical protein